MNVCVNLETMNNVELNLRAHNFKLVWEINVTETENNMKILAATVLNVSVEPDENNIAQYNQMTQ